MRYHQKPCPHLRTCRSCGPPPSPISGGIDGVGLRAQLIVNLARRPRPSARVSSAGNPRRALEQLRDLSRALTDTCRGELHRHLSRALTDTEVASTRPRRVSRESASPSLGSRLSTRLAQPASAFCPDCAQTARPTDAGGCGDVSDSRADLAALPDNPACVPTVAALAPPAGDGTTIHHVAPKKKKRQLSQRATAVGHSSRVFADSSSAAQRCRIEPGGRPWHLQRVIRQGRRAGDRSCFRRHRHVQR